MLDKELNAQNNSDWQNMDLMSDNLQKDEIDNVIETPIGNFEVINIDSAYAVYFRKKCFLCGNEFNDGDKMMYVPVETFYDDEVARCFLAHAECLNKYIKELREVANE